MHFWLTEPPTSHQVMPTLQDLLEAADSFIHEMSDSPQKRNALFCIKEAASGYEDGDGDHARYWALRSLRHSIGILHPAYKQFSAQ